MAEWSAVLTSSRNDPGSIPAEVKLFFEESSLEQSIAYRFELN